MPLTKQTPLKTFITDFLKSEDPRFAGDSKKKRVERATAAYYSKQNEELEDSIEAYSIEELQEFLDEETLDEISRNALGSYINKAAGEVAVNAASMALAKHRVTGDTLQHANIKRTAGIAKAVKKLAEPGKGNKTGDYIHNAVKDMDIKAYRASGEKDDEKFDALDRGIENRKAGIARAVDKEKIVKSGNALFDRAQPIAATRKRNASKNEEVEELEEVSKDTVQSYVKKSIETSDKKLRTGYLFGKKPKEDKPQTKEELEESGDKKSKHVADVINSIKTSDQPTKTKHLAYLKSIMDSADYANIERLLKTEDIDMYNEEIEELDELSKGTLGNYVKKAAKDIHRNAADADVFHDTQSQLNVKNRKAGIVKAIDRLTKEAVEESSKGETPPTEKQKKVSDALKRKAVGNKEELQRISDAFALKKEDLDSLDDEQFTNLAIAFEEEFGESIEKYFELTEEEIEEGIVIPFVSKASKSDRASREAKDKAGTKFFKDYVSKNLPGATTRPTSKHEAFFDAIQSDKLSEAKESLEDILAEKVVAKILELKEAIAKGRGTAVSPYHDTYRSALEGAYKHANDLGFDVHEDDQDTSSVDPKPSVGQTRSLHFRLLKDGKEHKKQLHAQVYNRGSEEGRQYELNQYIA